MDNEQSNSSEMVKRILANSSACISILRLANRVLFHKISKNSYHNTLQVWSQVINKRPRAGYSVIAWASPSSDSLSI
jgi:hypothetical protein